VAEVTVPDADTVLDLAAFEDPPRFADAIRYPHVAGKRAVADGGPSPAPILERCTDEH